MNMLVRKNVFEPLKIWDELDNWDGIFGSLMPVTKTTPIDITENEKEYHVKADVPGFEKDEISISLNDNILTIQGEKKKEDKDEKENYIRKERFYSSFSKSISLYENVDIDKIDASLKNGTLELRIPKKEVQEKPVKKIEVK